MSGVRPGPNTVASGANTVAPSAGTLAPGPSVRRAGSVATAGLVLLALTTLTGPRLAPPVYDGLCAADPYVSRPAAAGVTKTIDFSSPTAAQVITGESPPQVQVILPAGAVTGKATFRIAAVAPPSAAPPNGTVDGNVYSITATESGGSIAGISQPMSIVLRSPSSAAERIVDVYVAEKWTPLDTVTVSCAFQWLANTRTFGQFALVAPGAGTTSATPASRWTAVMLAGVMAGGLALAALVALRVRVRRRPRGRRRL